MADLLTRALSTKIVDILVAPSFARELATNRAQVVKIKSWIYSISRIQQKFGIDAANVVSKLPGRADGMFVSVVKGDEGNPQVQLHDGNHRMVALATLYPDMTLKELHPCIKFIHFSKLTDEDIFLLKLRDHSCNSGNIEYWFPPRGDGSDVEREDPGHYYEKIKVHAMKTNIPPNFRTKFSRIRMTTVADVCQTIQSEHQLVPVLPIPTVQVVLSNPFHTKGFRIVGDFTRWTHLDHGNGYKCENGPIFERKLPIGHVFRYKFYKDETNTYCHDPNAHKIPDGFEGYNNIALTLDVRHFYASPRHAYHFRSNQGALAKIRDRFETLCAGEKLSKRLIINLQNDPDIVETHDGNASIVAWLMYAKERKIPPAFCELEKSFTESAVVLWNRVNNDSEPKQIWHPFVPEELTTADELEPVWDNQQRRSTRKAVHQGRPVYFTDQQFFGGIDCSEKLGGVAFGVSFNVQE